MPPTPTPDELAALAFLATSAREHFAYEAVGVFWLWAELAILFAVREARLSLSGAPAKPWVPRFATWMLVFAVPIALVLLHTGYINRGIALDVTLTAENLAALHVFRVQRHLAIWSFFVLAWVLLESLIVVEGLRAYRHFAALCRHHLRPAAVTLLVVMSLGAASPSLAQATPESIGPLMAALYDAETLLQPYRNAVYLYLRIAGVVWIAVEWVAAIMLWRGQSLLWKVARRSAHA